MEEAGPAIMKRDAAGRVSYTERQREALLDEFERSGLKGAPPPLLTLCSWSPSKRAFIRGAPHFAMSDCFTPAVEPWL